MSTFTIDEINWLAIIVAAFSTFMLGGLWYTAIFGKAWVKAHGYDDAKVKAMQAKRPIWVFFGLLKIGYFAFAIALALLIHAANVHDAGGGAMIGAIAWLALAGIMLTNHVPTDVAWAGYLIDITFALVFCVGSGALLGAWQ